MRIDLFRLLGTELGIFEAIAVISNSFRPREADSNGGRRRLAANVAELLDRVSNGIVAERVDSPEVHMVR